MPNICDIHKETVGKYLRENHGEALSRLNEFKKLEPYRNTWHERVIREEVKQAAKDGKTKLQFPTGETAMKIEGLGGNADNWLTNTGRASNRMTLDDLSVGREIARVGEQEQWIITDVLGDGKFKAVPKKDWDLWKPEKMSDMEKELYKDVIQDGSPNSSVLERHKETFDISGKVDTNNPIYRFYEKEMAKYLKNKYGAKTITDSQGVTWNEIDVAKDAATSPINAFGFADMKVILGGAGAFVAASLLGPYFLGKSSNPSNAKQKGMYEALKQTLEQAQTGQDIEAVEMGLKALKDEKQKEDIMRMVEEARPRFEESDQYNDFLSKPNYKTQND